MSHDHYHFGGLADNAAGGQIHLPIVSNTINSEPTNIDRPDIGSAAGAARIWRSRRRVIARGFRPDVGKTLKASTKKNVGPAVVRYFRSISNSFFFNWLRVELAERVVVVI